MPDNENIRAIVTLIAKGRHLHAVKTWTRANGGHRKCCACLYAEMPRKVRCATCLESHLDFALLRRAHPALPPEQLSEARQSLKAWMRTL